MTFVPDGLVQRFLDILGVSVNTSTGQYIVFTIASAIIAVTIVCLMLLIFRFLVYLRKG